jgi:hypothetical protein
MTGMRDSIRSGAWFAALLAFGLALGFAWQLMQTDPKRANAAGVPWLSSAFNAVRNAVVADSSLPNLPRFALRATMVAANPANSTAVFDFGKGQIYTLHPGAMLPGVGRLLEIADKSVYLEVNGRRQLFAFSDSTLDAGEVLASAQALAQGTTANGTTGEVTQTESMPGARTFVVPATAPRYSDAPQDEPELNASLKPGQSIDTTVWN